MGHLSIKYCTGDAAVTHAKFLPFKKTRGGDDLCEAEAEVGNGAYAMFAADMVSRCTSSKHMWKMFTCRV